MKKWAKELDRNFSNGQKTHEMLNILNYKENANQNHTKIPPHSY
jgi:hypothetical protein